MATCDAIVLMGDRGEWINEGLSTQSRSMKIGLNHGDCSDIVHAQCECKHMTMVGGNLRLHVSWKCPATAVPVVQDSMTLVYQTLNINNGIRFSV